MATTQELIERLDRQYPGWDLYRTARRQWCVTIQAEGQKYQGSQDQIDSALSSALDWRPLPLVPVEPTVYAESEFDVFKDGSKWEIRRNGSFYFGNYPTKTAAKQALDQLLDRSRQNFLDWQEEWGWTRSKVEGVDFRLKS